jgi:hypothetical protein
MRNASKNKIHLRVDFSTICPYHTPVDNVNPITSPMNIIKHFDNPDHAQAFVESAFDSDFAEYYGLDYNIANTKSHYVLVAGTYPGGAFTRTVYFGQVEKVQRNQTLENLFAGFNAIYGGKP